MSERALFVRDGDDTFVATKLTQGGWDPGAANGGTVLALVGQWLDAVPSLVPMIVSRFTADLVRPVPIGRRLQLSHTVVREGKKIQVVELLLTVDGVEHVRASALRLRDADLSGQPDVPPSTTDSRPADVLTPIEESPRLGDPDTVGFLNAVDLRKAPTADGRSFGYWVKLDAAVVEGEPVLPTARLTFGFDFGNLVGVTWQSTAVTMINPDVSAHVLRPPRGEWLAIVGDTRFNPAMGRGITDSQLSDLEGLYAVTSMCQVVQLR